MKSSRKTGLLAMSFTVLLLVGFGCYRATTELGQNSADIDKASILAEAKKGGLIMDDQEIERMAAVPLTQISGAKQLDQPSQFNSDWSSWRSGALADVTGGTAFGLAHINPASNQFTIIAQMGGLQMPDENSFYEGWLVRRGDRPGIISLGKAVLVDDRFYVSFTAQENLESYNFFVLTLESNDLNPAPGKHLLEGIIE